MKYAEWKIATHDQFCTFRVILAHAIIFAPKWKNYRNLTNVSQLWLKKDSSIKYIIGVCIVHINYVSWWIVFKMENC